MQTKALGHDRNQRVRDFVRSIVVTEFEGNETRAAAAFGVSQSYLHEFLKGTRGTGMKLVNGVARYKRWPLDAIVSQRNYETQSKSRYANRELAIGQLVADGESEQDVRDAADAVAVALKSDVDPQVRRWVRAIEAILDLKRQGDTELALPGSTKLLPEAHEQSGPAARDRFRQVVVESDGEQVPESTKQPTIPPGSERAAQATANKYGVPTDVETLTGAKTVEPTRRSSARKRVRRSAR